MPLNDIMNKKEMIREIVGRGLLVSPDILDHLNEDTLQSILHSPDRSNLVMQSIPAAAPAKTELYKTVEKEQPNSMVAPEISIELLNPPKKEKFSTDDFVKYYNRKYSAIRDMLLKKTNATSINKIRDSSSPVTVIGMVKEMTKTGFVIEDPTGEIEVVADQTETKIAEDDVMAVSGYVRQGKLFGKEIILPDVPLTNTAGIMDARIMFSETPPKDTSNIDALCSPQKIVASNGDSEKLTNPAWLSISKNGSSIRLLVYRPEEGVGLADSVGLLKKRHLSPRRSQVFGPDDQFLVDNIPDVMWLLSEEKGVKIYKGVTIVSCGKNSSVVIDMKTRKVEFISTA